MILLTDLNPLFSRHSNSLMEINDIMIKCSNLLFIVFFKCGEIFHRKSTMEFSLGGEKHRKHLIGFTQNHILHKVSRVTLSLEKIEI